MVAALMAAGEYGDLSNFRTRHRKMQRSEQVLRGTGVGERMRRSACKRQGDILESCEWGAGDVVGELEVRVVRTNEAWVRPL